MTQSQYHTFMNYQGNIETPGIIVPQEVYRTDAVYQARPPIKFYNNGQLGIQLSDALACNFFGLADAHQPVVLNEGGVRVAIRILVCRVSHCSNRTNTDYAVVSFPSVARIHEVGKVGLCLRA